MLSRAAALEELLDGWLRILGSGGPRTTPSSSLEHLWVLSHLPQALGTPERDPACACFAHRARRLPGRHPLPSSGCCRTLCAWKTGLVFFQPSCSPATASLEKICTICLQRLRSDLVRSTGSDAWSGGWASLSVAPRVWPYFAIRQVIELPSRCAFCRRRRLGKSQKQLSETSALLGWLPYWQMGAQQRQDLHLSLLMILARVLE